MSQILEIIAKKALKDVAKKNINSKDPYFEEVAVYGRNGSPTGKVKKQKKGIPPGLSNNDGRVLKRVRKQAFRLDMCLFNCCGIRFGWSSVIGIIPLLGDIIDVFFAWMVVQSCCRVDGGLPKSIQYRMYFNVCLDFGIGLVPIVGDIADAVFRANTRNAWILEEYLLKKAEAERTGQLQKEKVSSAPAAHAAPAAIAAAPTAGGKAGGGIAPNTYHHDQETGIASSGGGAGGLK